MIFKYDKDDKRLVIQEASRIEYNQIKIWLRRKIKGWRFNPKVKMGIWDGTIDYFNKGSIEIGLWKECLKACNEIGAKFDVVNKKEFPLDRDLKERDVEDFCKEFFKDHKIIDKKSGELVPFMPYDYQIKTAYSILKNKYCLAQVATSGGKSLIISIVFFFILRNRNPKSKILVILPSISLIVQLHDNLIEYNRGINDENKNPVDLRVDEIMSDKPRKYQGEDDPNVYLSTFHSLAKVDNWGDEFYEQFDVVSVDESHKAKSNSISKILKKTLRTANYRFGVSGTFPEEDTCEILSIESLTGPIVSDINAKSLQDKGTISNVKINSISLNHNEPEFDTQLAKLRGNPNLGNKAYQLERKFIHQSDKRNVFISKLVGKFNKNSLLLFNIIEHGKQVLEKLEKDHPNIEFLYIDGSIKKADRTDILERLELNDGKLKVLLATFGTIGTGTSINNIHALVFLDSFQSEQLVIQAVGRILRLHEDKEKGIIFDLVDCFRENNQRNSYYRHGIERKRLYRKHKYPYTDLKFLLD